MRFLKKIENSPKMARITVAIIQNFRSDFRTKNVERARNLTTFGFLFSRKGICVKNWAQNVFIFLARENIQLTLLL